MEFLCLNCFATFDISEDQLPEPGSMLKCPICGHEQPFAGVKAPSRHTTRNARRISGEYRLTPKADQKQTESDSKISQIKRATGSHKLAQEKEPKTHYRVVSPSGLSFEFDDVNLVIRWGEMVANPKPYKVYKDNEEESVSLEKILEEKSSISRIRRRTTKLRQAAEAEAKARGDAEPSDTDVESQEEADVRPRTTSQFRFKSVEIKEEKKWPMMVVYLVLAALFGAAALFAFYVYVMQGSGR